MACHVFTSGFCYRSDGSYLLRGKLDLRDAIGGTDHSTATHNLEEVRTTP